MPVVLRVRGYRFWFYQADLAEPPHVHVGKADYMAKFWISPVALARAGAFRDHELSEIERILNRHQGDLMNAWRKEQEKRDSHSSAN